MPPVIPTWFKYRQGKTEEAGPDQVRLFGPNFLEAFIGVRKGEKGFHAFLRDKAEGEERAATARELPTAYEAWEAAFELYRTHFVV